MFLLDTDHLGIIQRQTAPEFGRLAERMTDHTVGDFCVSIISFHEQVAGWNAYIHRAKNSEGTIRAYRMFQGILADFAVMQVLPFDQPAAKVFQRLRKQHVRIGTMDLRIASIVISKSLTLLSRNLVDFRKVPDLQVEDWTTSQLP